MPLTTVAEKLAAPEVNAMDSTPLDRRTAAVTTCRRANGSQAQTVKSRVQRPEKIYPLAKTPTPAARQEANRIRRGLVPYGALLNVALANE
jgi:hypothetical protein